MNTNNKFKKIVDAASWKEHINLSFSTNRYTIKAESIAYLPKQTAIVAKHDHILYKFRYFPSGGGVCGIGEDEFSITPRTFMIIPPFTSHYQLHSPTTPAEEYTLFLEITPVKSYKPIENKTFYNDFDNILDIIINEPYFFGVDFHNAGKEIEKLCKYMMKTEGQINISQFWTSIFQIIITAAHNIQKLPKYDIKALSSSPDEQRISVLDFIFRTYHEEMSQERVARMLGISVRHLNRIIMKYYNLTFKQKYTQSRLELATTLLEEAPSLSIDEISQKLNFSTDRYFSKCFKEYYGISPSEYRKKSDK